MNDLCSFATIVAGLFGMMMTMISFDVFKNQTMLENFLISGCVGVLTFISFRYPQEGIWGVMLFGYKAVPITILFLLLWRAFHKMRKAQEERKQKNQIAKQSSQLREAEQDLQKLKPRSSRCEIQQRED